MERNYRTRDEAKQIIKGDFEIGNKKKEFTLVLSADYQMQKLVPYWGCSPQPGSMYYLQKLSNDIFGIVDHRTQTCMLYVFDETVGPKNTDHTVSYTNHYICESGQVPTWVKNIHIFLDNTVSTNKNAFFMAWMLEQVKNSPLKHIRVSFLIVGHTKFDIDRVFSTTAKAYASTDVFTTEELASVMSQSDKILSIVDNGTLVKPSRKII